MKHENLGWIIVDTHGVPVVETNHPTRKDCIHYFVQWWCTAIGLEKDWGYITRTNGYRCVRLSCKCAVEGAKR